jgi:vitamin B12 transporter
MRRFSWICLAGFAATTALVPARGAAQDAELGPAHAALEACARVDAEAAGAQSAVAKRAADDAERAFRTLLRAYPDNADVRVGLAQVLIRCQLRHANVSGIMSLVGEAEGELRSVLSAQPEHWSARFTLAMLLKNMPAMLGRDADAVREFELLLARQGRRGDQPHFAQPFVQLGDLHDAAGRKSMAVDVWRRGLALFPAHPELRGRLEAAGVEALPDSTWLSVPAPGAARVPDTKGDATDHPTDQALDHVPDQPPVYAFAPLRAEALNHHFQDARPGTTLRRLDVYTMPGGTGEMLQALQALPGATRVGDGAELYIRGGDPAETPVFFDGGRLAFPGRWESFQGSAMGVVDASVLRRAYFSSGGFSARYGNALSGIVDVETEGRPARSTRRIGVNMVQAGGTVRARAGERTGVWATLSGTDVRLVSHMTGESDAFTRPPQSVQGIGGMTFEPVPGIELRTTLLAVGDRFGRRVEMNGHDGEFESWSSMQHAAVSVRALRPDGRRGISGSLTASRRDGGMRFGVLDREREDRALGGRMDADVVAFGGTRIRGGIELLRYDATTTGRVPTTPALTPGSPALDLPRENESDWHAGAYVEAEHAPLPGLAVVAGFRVDALPGETGAVIDPRLGAAYTAGDWTMRLGAGVFHQGSWRARYRLPDPGQPSGTPRRAEHLVAGVERSGTLSLRAEAYVKRYGDYAPAGDGPPVVEGTNTGLDAIARWSPRSGPGGWLSYSLLRGRIGLATGEELPSALDVTHSVTSVLRVPLHTAWELGATARYATGRPFTPLVAAADGAAPAYGPTFGERLPDHRRLDARVSRYFFRDGGRMALLYLEMLNVLDRRNIMGYTYSAAGARRLPIDAVFAHRTFVLGAELQFD